MSCGVGGRRSLDLAWLWLWCRPVATAPLGPLAWDPPYAAGVALEKAKGPKNKQTKIIVFVLTFRTLVHFELIFVYSER